MITPSTYVYDVEVAPNFFGVTFIPVKRDNAKHQSIIDTYINVDIKLMAATRINDVTTIISLNAVKRKLLIAMGAKIFNIFKDYEDNSNSVCELPEICDFFYKHKILYGYNSNNYDKNIMAYVLRIAASVDSIGINYKSQQHVTADIYTVSQKTIDLGRDVIKYVPELKYHKSNFTDFDIQKILYLDKTFVALKFVAIVLKWYRIQTLPYKYNEYLTHAKVIETNDYNVNDVLITRALIVNQMEELDLRKELTTEFKVDVLNLSRSSISNKLVSKYYEYLSGTPYKEFRDLRTERYIINLKDVVQDNISFKSNELNEVLNTINKTVIKVGSTADKDKLSLKFQFKNTTYSIGMGGLHSVDDRRCFDSKIDGYVYKDADVTSYYPSGISILNVCPRHLERTPFKATINYIKSSRVEAKHLGRKNKAEGLKIAINAAYGKFKDRFSFLYDPLCTYTITVNLQLYLMMLIEDLESTNVIEVISANTDGIVSRFKPEYESLYDSICASWEKSTMFELEYAYYEKYIRNDVNNYIAIKRGFYDAIAIPNADINTAIKSKVKFKGLFIEDVIFNKGYFAPIIAKALNDFFIFGKDYTKTIIDHIHNDKFNIYDYCISQKANRKFTMMIRTVEDGAIVEKEIQNTNRFYVTADKTTTIVKLSSETRNELSILTKVGISIINDYVYKDDYNIDFSFYINQCSKIVNGSEKSNKRSKVKRNINSGVIKPQLSLFNE